MFALVGALRTATKFALFRLAVIEFAVVVAVTLDVHFVAWLASGCSKLIAGNKARKAFEAFEHSGVTLK